MAKLMNVLEALRDGLILEGDYINLSVCFKKDNNENLIWFYSEDYNKVPTLFGITTEVEKHSYESLDNMCSTYSSLDLGMKARRWKSEDIKYLIRSQKISKILERDLKGFIAISLLELEKISIEVESWARDGAWKMLPTIKKVKY